jgi:hypothetical protein
MKAGDIYTVAGDGKLALYGDGGRAVDAPVQQPTGVAVNSAGNLLIGATGYHRVQRVTG